MSVSAKPAMRLLSSRLQCLRQQPQYNLRQIRNASSRYSSPSKRSVTTAHNLESLFVNSKDGRDVSMRNSLDVRAARLAYQEKRSYHLRRMRFAGMGLLLSMAALALIIYNLDLDKMEQSEQKRRRSGQQLDASDDANAKFQGREVQVIGAGEGKRIIAQGDGLAIELVETGTSTIPHFPRTIYLPSSNESSASSSSPGVLSTAQPNAPQNPNNIANQEQYTLVGLGIRTVLWIQVYVVGMYVRTTDISELQAKLIHNINSTASTLVPAEKETLRKRLLDPETSREIWTELLKVPGIKTAWRIAPTRNTDFGHLRDGFINGINARTAEARKLVQGGETDYDSEDFGQSVQSLKGIFSGGKAPKGSILILLRDQMGSLDVLFQAKPGKGGKDQEMEKLGTVPDERIAKLIWLGYLGGAKVSSPAAREGVAEGCVGFAGRPVGSVETMVT